MTSFTSAPARSTALKFLGLASVATLALTACGGSADEPADAAESAEATEGTTESAVTIEDDHGTHDINLSEVDSIGAFDNRSFRTLEEFGVELSVAARSLMDEEVHGYANDEDILDTGNHREPNLENLIAAEPQLIINGQRYSQYYEDMQDMLPDATILEFDNEVNEPDTFFQGLINKTESLGEVFGEQEAASEIIADLQTELDRISELYDGESTVLGLMTSGGAIQYIAPETGRTLGPVFPEFDLVPALEMDAEDESHGDDISVEAIAEANPDWILVIDRDARIGADEPEYQPAEELIEDSPALQNVTAIEEGHVVYTAPEMYLTEDIQAYTEFLRSFADTLESAQ